MSGRRMVAALAATVIGVAACGSAPVAGPDQVSMTLVGTPTHVVAAFVPVTIAGHRYAFRVDSGAGRSVVDATVAAKLALPAIGAPSTSYAVGCPVPTEHRMITSWSVGAHLLPAAEVSSQAIDEAGIKVGGLPIAGFLGADVLSRFGSVRLDFRHRRLGLGVFPAAGGPGSVPLSVVHIDGDVVARATLAVGGSARTATVTVDTGATDTYLASATAASLGLSPGGDRVNVGTVACTVTAHDAPVVDARLGQVPVGLSEVLVGPDQLAAHVPSSGGGLVGEDVLGRDGSLTLDFRDRHLVLGG